MNKLFNLIRGNRNRLLQLAVFVVFKLLSLAASATEEPYLNELKGTQVAVGNAFTVVDEKFGSTPNWTLQRIDNIISFEINFDTSIYFYNQPFDCEINFKIYIYGNASDTSEITDSTTYADIHLKVIYDTATGSVYKGIALYKFRNAHKFKVKILGITSPQLSPIPAIFRLKGQVIVNRQYDFEDNSTDVTRFSILNDNQLKLEWTPSLYPGAEMFDLEYTYIDFHSEAGSRIRTYSESPDGLFPVPVDTLDKWFRNNSTRITTSASSYLINVPYDSGYVLFRIRGVQVHFPDNLRWEGNWNYSATSVEEACTEDCPTGVLFFAGHEQKMNWQFSISFAEEGKRKEVVSYFDGTLRNRQSVTISNSDNKSIVAETIYDALGRAGASILPAPTTDSTIHYFRGFNRNSGGTNPYSFSDLILSSCNTTADSVSWTSGAGKYYSTGNPFLNSHYYAKYIPNAGGYPLAVTEYMADNTGRVKAQSGVGSAFMLGAGHETRYFYGKATQTELDRLFGLEAGDASHYLKNMVVDANGQISVSYQDAGGRTIATALAGASPANLRALPSNGEGTSVLVSNELIKPGDFTRNGGENTLTASATFLAPVTGEYRFTYRIEPLVYQKLFGPDKDSSICSNCYYDLEVTVLDDCNNILQSDTVLAGNIFDTSCSTPPVPIEDSFAVDVEKIGGYYVRYTLRVSQQALVYYDSVHFSKNSDIKGLDYFLREELKNTDFYGCYSNCETCIDKLGTSQEFLTSFQAMYFSDSLNFGGEDSALVLSLYDSLYAHCQSLQATCGGTSVCDEKLDLLKMDVSPGGQYALYDSTYTLQEVPINRLAMRNQIAWFTNEYGERDSVLLFNMEGEDSVKVDVNDLSDSLFIQHWKDSWADSLVKLHPEYCYYLWCLANANSFEFDRQVENWEDADSVMSFGWFDPADYKALLDADPFFNTGGNGLALYGKMAKDLRLFSRSRVGLSLRDKNILQFVDVTLYCNRQANGWTDCYPDSACRSRSREWFLYKNLYLNLKQKYYEEARRTSSDTVFANCTNCFIGGGDIISSVFSCPDTSQFALSEVTEGEYKLSYTGPGGFVMKKVFVTLKQTNTSPPGVEYPVYVFEPGDSVLSIEVASATLDSIISVSCDTTGWTPFTDSLCNYTCPTGTYTPYDRDSVSFYIEYGNPATAPSGTPGGYGNCQFYPVFDVQTDSASSCRFFNVWVCVYDSTCGGVCEPDSSFASSCPDDPDAHWYVNKERRYPEYVQTDQLTQELMAGNAAQESAQQLIAIGELCYESCSNKADYWMSKLSGCGMSSGDSIALRAALIEICAGSCSIENPYGASSLPANMTATYHSFEEAIEAILGPGAITSTCTQELLANPYPFDRQPVYTEKLIVETNYEICQRIGFYRQQYLGSGYSGSFHRYMLEHYAGAYALDSTELDDLLNACFNCGGILKNDLVLPAIFDPAGLPCQDCDSMQVALTVFTTKFPSLSVTDDNYEELFTNFFNHRFGFSLIYQQYRDFLDSCDANPTYEVRLCTGPVSEQIEVDDNACLKELYANALTNATYRYLAYADSIHKDFREAWTTKCMNAQPALTMEADLYEYHYTLYYYDQSGNLVKTVPPEGVAFLDETQLADLKAIRVAGNNYCPNNNSLVFTNGHVDFPGGSTHAPEISFGTGNFTIETWINLNSYEDQGILSNNYFDAGINPFNKGYSLEVLDSTFDFLLGSSFTSKIRAKSPLLIGRVPLDTWTHLVVQRTDGNTIRMFINGNEVPVTYLNTSWLSVNTDHPEIEFLYVGASNRNGSVTKIASGKLKNVRLYKRSLPATEVRQNYMDYCGNPASKESMVFWERFNEGRWEESGGEDYVYDEFANSPGQAFGTLAFENPGDNTLVPAHRLVTVYQYNSLNQVLQQYSPDGDSSWFFYDRLGRLIVSQNKEQKENSSYSGAANRFSYTRYDALGRITEVGEKSSPATNIRSTDLLDTTAVAAWVNSGTDRQVTKTLYDEPIDLSLQTYSTSRKRVVASIYLEQATDTEGDSTLYAYDILGNVKTLTQSVKAMVAIDAGNGKKRIDYDYDLVSGKVNLVSYQPGKGDQFFYKYRYDADNRVISSYSSRDKLIWQEDAAYTYYLHGPLARTELGQYKVQGTDYAYTLQGWLKGINSDSLHADLDMAGDGKSGALFGRVSRDVFGFTLGYFGSDYTPIGASASAFTSKVYTAPGSPDNTGNELFNGNISHTTLALSKINGGATAGYSYGYDQLNRLVEMRQHITGTTAGWSNSSIITAYRESIGYDANGNILQYLRKGAADTPDMDSLNYAYNRDGSGNLQNNRLNHVNDAISSGKYTIDIDDQAANNYIYDHIGNLKADVAEDIDTIRWTVYGKINRIVKNSGSTIIDYGYDPGGNRTYKKVKVEDTVTTTFYIRDAQGNVMGIYTRKDEESIKWSEQHLYGSSRLGIWKWDAEIPAAPPVVDEEAIFDSLMFGMRQYELSNHLGNVLSTISDKKVGHDSSWVVDYYVAEVLSQNDYYPFGMGMPERSYSVSDSYRYGFNGKENDNEVKGEGNQQDYGMRIYDTKVGRFLSVDPKTVKYPDLTPYSFAAISPIWLVDKNGEEPDRNQAGTINQATGQWAKLENQTVEGILNFIQADPNAVKYIYTQDKGWIDLQHYFGTLKYGKEAMDLLEQASGNKIMQDMVFGEGANESYYSYEDLPSNQFASEAKNLTLLKEEWAVDPSSGLSYKQLKSENKIGSDLINSVKENFVKAKAVNPESAPNWRMIPFKDHGERQRLPEVKEYKEGVRGVGIPGAYVYIKTQHPVYYTEEEKKKLLQTGNYVPQNHSSQPYDLNNFPAAPSSLQNGDKNKSATGHN